MVYGFIPFFSLGIDIANIIVSHGPLLRVFRHGFKLLEKANSLFGLAIFGQGIPKVVVELGIFRILLYSFFIKLNSLCILPVAVCIICLTGIIQGCSQQEYSYK